MIRSSLKLSDGSFVQKNGNLIEEWRRQPDSFLWLDLVDEDEDTEKALLLSLNCHPLAIQDAQRLRHPPKIEIFDDNIFILYRGIFNMEPELLIERMQIGVFVTRNLIVTRHKLRSYAIEHWWNAQDLTEVIKSPLLLATKMMLHSFGRYLEVILEFEQLLSEKEDSIQGREDDEDLRALTVYKSRLRKLRRDFNYHERLVAVLLTFVTNNDEEYYSKLEHDIQDLHERAERIASLLSMYYEISGDLIEGYLSLTSHKLNKTMQILTVVTTIFVPLGFLAGVYGMNFDNIPELHFKYGYFYLLGTMIVIATSAFTLFKLKRWI